MEIGADHGNQMMIDVMRRVMQARVDNNRHSSIEYRLLINDDRMWLIDSQSDRISAIFDLTDIVNWTKDTDTNSQLVALIVRNKHDKGLILRNVIYSIDCCLESIQPFSFMCYIIEAHNSAVDICNEIAQHVIQLLANKKQIENESSSINTVSDNLQTDDLTKEVNDDQLKISTSPSP
jgi:hypothetical protein